MSHARPMQCASVLQTRSSKTKLFWPSADAPGCSPAGLGPGPFGGGGSSPFARTNLVLRCRDTVLSVHVDRLSPWPGCNADFAGPGRPSALAA